MTLQITLVLFYLASIPLAIAQSPLEAQDDDKLRAFVSQINHYSPADGAASLGTFGTKISLSSQMTESKTSIQEPWEYIESAEDWDDKKALYLPRLTLSRGLPWPISLGVSFGMIEGTEIQQWAGFGQWTVFEKLALPTLGLRYTLSKISGHETFRAMAHGLEAIGSYGFLRYFQAFVSVRSTQHTLEQTAAQPLSWMDATSAGGLEIMILPPFTTIAVEGQLSEGSYRSYQARLSYLL